MATSVNVPEAQVDVDVDAGWPIARPTDSPVRGMQSNASSGMITAGEGGISRPTRSPRPGVSARGDLALIAGTVSVERQGRVRQDVWDVVTVGCRHAALDAQTAGWRDPDDTASVERGWRALGAEHGDDPRVEELEDALSAGCRPR